MPQRWNNVSLLRYKRVLDSLIVESREPVSLFCLSWKDTQRLDLQRLPAIPSKGQQRIDE
jgi:hypothetical protein